MSDSGLTAVLAGLAEHSEARRAIGEGLAVEAEARRLEEEVLAQSLAPPLAGLLEQATAMAASARAMLAENGPAWPQAAFVNEIQSEMVAIAGQIRTQIAQTLAAGVPDEEPAGTGGVEPVPPKPKQK